MKIQFVLNYGNFYGANRSVLSVIEHFRDNGHNVNVLVPSIPSRKGMFEELQRRNIACETLPFYAAFLYYKLDLKHLSIPLLTVLDIFVFPFFVLKIKKFNPDIIYSNTSAENFGILVAKLLKIKHITHVREFMDKDYSLNFLFGKKNKKKFINMSDAVIYVSKSVMEAVQGTKVIRQNHKVIYNGIDSKKTVLNKKTIDKNQLTFGIVGSLDPAKGQLEAVKYFSKILKKYPTAKLFIYGDKPGVYKDKIFKHIESFDLMENVIFKGFEADLDKVYSSMDVLLMFSKSEGFGRVTIEAAFNGVPVIGFDNAGTSELIRNKETGCLFHDYKSFIDAVDFLLNGESENYQNIRKSSFENAWKLYSKDICCTNIADFVEKVHV